LARPFLCAWVAVLRHHINSGQAEAWLVQNKMRFRDVSTINPEIFRLKRLLVFFRAVQIFMGKNFDIFCNKDSCAATNILSELQMSFTAFGAAVAGV
jgi:hypothetical protein